MTIEQRLARFGQLTLQIMHESANWDSDTTQSISLCASDLSLSFDDSEGYFRGKREALQHKIGPIDPKLAEAPESLFDVLAICDQAAKTSGHRP